MSKDDVIEVEVRRHPEFSGKYTVTAEGKIEYKFIGDVLVDGLTKIQLQERLTAILSDYIIEPEVNVQILQYLSKVYYVIGSVNRPGKFYMKGNTIPILPPDFNKFKQRSINKTSVSELMLPVSYKSKSETPILSFTCFKAFV